MGRRKRGPAISDEEMSSEDEPITQTLRKRGGRRSQQEEEEEEEELEVPLSGNEEEEGDGEEDAARPSKRPSRRQTRSRGEVSTAPEPEELPDEEEEEAAAPSAAAAATKAKKKSKRKGKRAARRTADAEDNGQGSDGEDSEPDNTGDALEEASAFYELEATQVAEAEQDLVSEAEERKLVRSIMRYMLFLQHQKPGVPAKRQDLITIIMKGYRGSAKMKKLGGLIIKKAQAEFVKICGMEMKEVTPQLHSRQGQQDGPTVYTLRSLLPPNLRVFARSEAMDVNNGLAMVLGALITLAGGKLSEDDLQIQMEKIGIVLSERHPVLGKPLEQVQALVQKKMLAESRENGCDGVKKVYAMGDCFTDEVQEDNLANFIEKVFSHAPMSQPAAA